MSGPLARGPESALPPLPDRAHFRARFTRRGVPPHRPRRSETPPPDPGVLDGRAYTVLSACCPANRERFAVNHFHGTWHVVSDRARRCCWRS
ncbi:hypothetical protein ACU686_40915 [Yinghuangia aomiensis]